MSNIERHRIDASIINKEDETNGNNNKYIYINDQLTFNNRQLLWLAKTKAKESSWKFVWVRSGNIFAKENKNSPFILISNAAISNAI